MPADIEFEDKEAQDIIPLTELDKDDAKADDDIIEIAEFDQHYPYDDDESLEHGSLLDPADLEDKDFIELFDIEEDGSIEDEEMKELSEAEEKAVEAELSRFFEDALEDETGDENNTHPPVEKFSERDTDLNLSTTAAALLSGAGKIDRPATLLTQDPTKKEPASNADNTAVVSPEQIDQAIERIVNEKLAGRVENIIYEVIEKAVKREIEQLKASLLGDSTPDNRR